MEMTQFAMVEELARIVKDNLFSKHLVLSTEEALVHCLQNDESSDRVLELEPMSSYHRSLLHRLAEIFGFSHESVGEGDARHLVLERCAESSIPPILVSDLLWDIDNYQPSPATHILKRDSPSDMRNTVRPLSSMTIEEREAAYLTARERIFSVWERREEHVQLRPRGVPVTARRMIAHALGRRMSSLSLPLETSRREQHEELEIATEKSCLRTMRNACKDDHTLACENLQEVKVPKYAVRNTSSTLKPERKPLAMGSCECSLKSQTTSSRCNSEPAGTSVNLEKEHAGAAKRMFAHALGLSRGRGVRCNE